MQLSVQLLGAFDVQIDDARVDPTHWSRRSAAQLVQLLALAPGHRMHREQVLDALWPEHVGSADLAPRLHKAAHFARRALGAQDSVVLVGSTVQLAPGATVTVDAVQFEAATEDALTRSDADAAREAAGLYAGDLLPDSPYEEWLSEPRDRLRGLYLDALRLGELWPALAEADPTSERAHLELARTAALAGDVSGAVRQLENLERALDRELGIAPSDAVVELRDRLVSEAQRRIPAVDHAVRPPLRTTTVPVGRAAEAARIDRLLTDVGFGHGQALFVVGGRGMGCSYLLTFLEHQARSRGMRVGSGSLAQTRAHWPYAPVLDALSHLCRGDPSLLDRLDATARSTLRRAMGARELDWDGSSTHQHLYVAAAELLRLAADGAGALLVVDDIDDADEASLELFHYLTRATAGSRVLLATAILPVVRESVARVRAGLEARDQATVIELHQLDRDHAVELLSQYVSDPAVVDTLAEAVPGVPYDLVEAATAAARGVTDPVRAMLPFAPDSQLGAFLEVAALPGRTFHADDVAAVLGIDGTTAFELIEEAVSRGILMREGTVPTFRHDLVRESVLCRIPSERRREWHVRFAEVLQETDGPASCVAHHLLEAGKGVEAVSWTLRAAQTDAALGAYRNALERLDRVRRFAEGPDAERLALLRADALGALSEPAALDAYREALDLASDVKDRTKVRVRLARAALFLGELDTARTALDGLELAGLDQADDALHLLAEGHLHLYSGNLEDARRSADEARRRIAISPRASVAAFELVTFDGLLAHRSGRWFHRLRSALRRGADKPDLATVLFDSHLCVAEYLLYGPTPYDEVRELARNLRESAERSGVLRAVAFAAALGGEAALLSGDLEVARRELEEAVALHRKTTSLLGEAHSMQRLAETYLAMGDKEHANRILSAALPLARWSPLAGCLLPRVFGSQVAAAPNAAPAVAIVDGARASLGVEDHCSFCSIALDSPAAQALAAAGDVEGARMHLAAAETSAERWQSPAWHAAVLEARAAIAEAAGDLAGADEMLGQAADTYASAGQVLDARRCAELVSTSRRASRAPITAAGGATGSRRDARVR